MSMTKVAIRKERCRVNAPLEWWGCTNSHICLMKMFHTYSKCANNRDPDIAEISKQSVQEYAKLNSSTGGNMISHCCQYGRGQTSSTTTCSIFAKRRDNIEKSWNEEGFRSLDQAFPICEIFIGVCRRCLWIPRAMGANMIHGLRRSILICKWF